ncbi:hypothetical protein ACJJTC_008017 [Scirpophaga incertulas]
MSRVSDVGTFPKDNNSYHGEKLIYPAANRNKEPILQVLKRFILHQEEDEESHLFLEIASGSGQHLAHFAPNFPRVQFQPTEIDESLLGSITYYADSCETKNILPPKQVDICNKLSNYGFIENSVDYLYCANMIHISPFKCTVGLFENAQAYLKSDALMITYGPYSKERVITPQSNIDFDASLRARDPSWGLRDINDLVKLGEENNLILIDTIDMPANNKILIWKKC